MILHPIYIKIALRLLRYMEGVILRSNIPMKEILQYSDKLKIDKFLLGVKLEDALKQKKNLLE